MRMSWILQFIKYNNCLIYYYNNRYTTSLYTEYVMIEIKYKCICVTLVIIKTPQISYIKYILFANKKRFPDKWNAKYKN